MKQIERKKGLTKNSSSSILSVYSLETLDNPRSILVFVKEEITSYMYFIIN
ncbi:hypothetical protein [Dysgonomonas sp. 511]|uniref:hypothetical protein n=1 Tax=Dysgonomonas sp. 511 TaxID=2302930 RepID=UPI0013D04EC8|nr:hypothetical protein [Dysgonomonas sp. 511]